MISRRRWNTAAAPHRAADPALHSSNIRKKTLGHFALISVPCSAFQFASWGTGSPDWMTTAERRRGDRGAAGVLCPEVGEGSGVVDAFMLGQDQIGIGLSCTVGSTVDR